jgi:phosphate transport system substrate-binding protein
MALERKVAMDRIRTLVILLIAAVLTAGCVQTPKPQPVADQPLKTVVAGSGSNLPITRELAKAYSASTGRTITIPESISSGGAINAVTFGELALGLISRPLTPAEKAKGLKELPYARVAVIFGVHRAVPDESIAAADVLAIIDSRKTAWNDGSRIYVLLREKTDSSNQLLGEALPDYRDTLNRAYQEERWQVIYTDADEADAIRRTPGAFGFTDSSYVKAAAGGIKPLAFEGVEPSLENVANGKYKLFKNLSFVYKGEFDKEVAGFVAYVFSPAGREVIGRMGALPLGR